MAKLEGIIKIQGTLENLTFYKSTDGQLVRTKGGVSKNRIMNDPAFKRTRENGSEFGECAHSGKLLRTAVGTMLFHARDRRLTSRMLALMAQIKNQDSISARGERNVANGIGTTAGQLLLKGFDFNAHAALSSIFYVPFTLDTASGKVNIPILSLASRLWLLRVRRISACSAVLLKLILRPVFLKPPTALLKTICLTIPLRV